MFVRYADDIIVHCETKQEAEQVLETIKARMAACHLQLHDKKTKIVFCKRGRYRSNHKTVKFDFLGFSYQPRPTARKNGKMFLGYDCAISQSNEKKIIEEIAEFFEKKIIGWVNYYGKFRRHKLYWIFKVFDRRLIDWARRRYKRFNRSFTKACKWFYRFREENPKLFAHWRMGFINA